MTAGCGVDIPSHFYSWSWSLNGNWSHPFVGQEEILQCTYLRGWALTKICIGKQCSGISWRKFDFVLNVLVQNGVIKRDYGQFD